MRAGLLSEKRVVQLLNEKFVSTWVLVDELKKAAPDNPFADTLLKNWEYPLDLMFLTPEGQLVSKLNSFRDLPGAHPDVGHHDNPFGRSGPSHSIVFFRHVEELLSR